LFDASNHGKLEKVSPLVFRCEELAGDCSNSFIGCVEVNSLFLLQVKDETYALY